MFNMTGLYVAGALALAGAGLFTYHKLVVSSQQQQIADLTAANKQLKSDVDLAVNANKSMKDQVDKIALQSQQLVSIMSTLQKKDAAVATWFNEAKNNLSSDASRGAIAEKLKDNPAAIIDDANAEMECVLANLGKLGSCSGGKFIEFQGPQQ